MSVKPIREHAGKSLLEKYLPEVSGGKHKMGCAGVLVTPAVLDSTGSQTWDSILQAYATKFIEMILMVTADHGPAVSGAHNTIVTARAGKDLVSSLCSGLLTIGPRFGGALDDAARMFADAQGSGVAPKDWIEKMKKSNQLIMGIGHRIKSLANPDQRVEIIKGFAKKNFNSTPVLDYALAVEQITTRKRANLILNVDGCIAVSFVDMIRSCGAFSKEECDDLMDFGCLNGLFVLGRSIGFIGHYLDQLRLKQPLYRHPWDDITYIQELAGQGPES
ncbi:Acly [Symbiodinium microadriaticum]|nr:Acly [Symbiodinium microadriaticum]CAE7949098.1 Acly [Symbiodinium sp. KB8]